jgi:hypothetical protein
MQAPLPHHNRSVPNHRGEFRRTCRKPSPSPRHLERCFGTQQNPTTAPPNPISPRAAPPLWPKARTKGPVHRDRPRTPEALHQNEPQSRTAIEHSTKQKSAAPNQLDSPRQSTTAERAAPNRFSTATPLEQERAPQKRDTPHRAFARNQAPQRRAAPVRGLSPRQQPATKSSTSLETKTNRLSDCDRSADAVSS